jgi:hypothetical protein
LFNLLEKEPNFVGLGCVELWRVSMLIWYGSYLCYIAVVYSIRIGVQLESVIVFCLRSGLWK